MRSCAVAHQNVTARGHVSFPLPVCRPDRSPTGCLRAAALASWHAWCFGRAHMITRLALAATLLALASPAFAQPAKQPPKQPAKQPPAAPTDDFEKDLDALFAKGGLTSDQAA